MTVAPQPEHAGKGDGQIQKDEAVGIEKHGWAILSAEKPGQSPRLPSI